VVLADARGALAAVLVGIADSDDVHAFSALPLLLPTGRYRLHESLGVDMDAERAALGWGLGAYQFSRYRTPRRAASDLCVDDAARNAAERQLDAIWRVRDLINTPAEHMGPADLA